VSKPTTSTGPGSNSLWSARSQAAIDR
jgi:hypothetical protein